MSIKTIASFLSRECEQRIITFVKYVWADLISVTGKSIKEMILWIVLAQCIKTRAIYSIVQGSKTVNSCF